MANSKQTSASEELKYASANLKRETGWWGAFVIGLAGTILVTGIAPVMVTQLGASAIPITIFITLTGWLLCLILAELAAMMPERTGGSPSFRLSCVQGPLAPICEAHQRLYRLGLLAWLVSCGAA